VGRSKTEAQYLSVVENKILVDIQGDDCLYQIFTGVCACVRV
jgi:hypothetical protein